MSTTEEWNESLDNMDYLISCMENLEREDVIYLEEYLIGDGSLDSQSPSHWASLTEEKGTNSMSDSKTDEVHVEGRGCVAEQAKDERPNDPGSLVETVRNGDDDNVLRTTAPTRSTRGVTKPKFVTYESFPATKEKPFMCELCGLRLATRESRRRHILAKHIKERTNFCSVCGKAFIFKFALRAHKAVHSDTPSFICVCGMSFTVRASYMDHIKRIHRAASEIKYPCELCFKSFGDRHTLRLHLISVHKTKTIACMHNGCDKIFSTIGLMRSHYRYHLKERFACDECGQSFSTESYMYKHRLTHSGIRPYVCVDCGKTYLSMSHLNKHRRAAHSSDRPFQCSFCGKCYKTKDQLTYHESSHKGEKPFQCDICGYASAYRNTYYAHKKKHQLTSIPNKAHGMNQKKTSITDNQAANISEVHGKVKDKGKVIKKNSSLSKSKSKIDSVSTEKKSYELTPSQMLNCGTRSLPLLAIEGVGHVAGKDVSVSPCACRSPSVNVICVVSTGSNSAAELQQELPVPQKVLSKSTMMESVSENRDIQMLNNCVPSSPVHQTIVHYKDSKMSISENDLPQNDGLESFDIPSDKDGKNGEYILSSEKQNLFIVLSNNGNCAIPTCESIDDSLLLFKTDDNSYVGVCSHHTFSDHSVESRKDEESIEQLTSVNLNVQSLDNVNLQTEYDSRIINNDLISAGSTSVSLIGEGSDIQLTQGQQPRTDNQMALITLPDKYHTEVRHDDSAVQETSDLVTEISRGHNSASVPLSNHNESLKSSSDEMSPAEFPTIMELDPGVTGTCLTGHIVDDSFSLAQMEVVCPICDEQFLCMDAYVTHLECSHN